MDLRRWLDDTAATHRDWADTFGRFDTHPSLEIDDERFGAVFADFTDRLRDNYPFFHPSYVSAERLTARHPKG